MKIKEEIEGQLGQLFPETLDDVGVSFLITSVEGLAVVQSRYPKARWRSKNLLTERPYTHDMPYYLANDYPEDPYSFGYGDAPRFKVIQL